MKNQYLLIAETIFYKNNKLTAINIYDHFVALKLPAEFVFDLAVLCGPGWEHGEHVITINFRPDDKELTKLKFTIGSDVKNLSFIVMEGDKVIVERTYPVNGLMIPVEEKPKEESAAE